MNKSICCFADVNRLDGKDFCSKCGQEIAVRITPADKQSEPKRVIIDNPEKTAKIRSVGWGTT
ncbi:MAG: hypothetical protein WC120_04275 [Parcubacteria group bacterium]